LPIEFFERHPKNARWDIALVYCKLSLDFLNRNLDHLDWNSVSLNNTVPLDFLEAHLNKINWAALCIGQTDFNKWFETKIERKSIFPNIPHKPKGSRFRQIVRFILEFLGYGAWARAKL
jgi:hypothetical protein